MNPRYGLAAFLLALFPAPPAAAESQVPDTFLGRLKALASLETLNASLLAGRSATATLATWCADHGMAEPATIHALRVEGAPVAPSHAQRARLGVGPDEPIRYRHVRLACGSHVLSDAENWYVPSRLRPDMNEVLDRTDTPFGKAVAPLHFTRETFAVEDLFQPLAPGWEERAPPAEHPGVPLDLPPVLFTHRALLYDANHRPFAEVVEHYTREALTFGAR